MKVGKNNFRPPPQVESSVVRLEPRWPKPQINLEEYDGVLRIAFNRPNKTLSANFKTRTVLEMLEKNFKTLCAVEGKDVPMDFEVGKEVSAVLDSVEMGEKRANKMEVDEFLKVLKAFNDRGFHFA